MKQSSGNPISCEGCCRLVIMAQRQSEATESGSPRWAICSKAVSIRSMDVMGWTPEARNCAHFTPGDPEHFRA